MHTYVHTCMHTHTHHQPSLSSLGHVSFGCTTLQQKSVEIRRYVRTRPRGKLQHLPLHLPWHSEMSSAVSPPLPTVKHTNWHVDTCTVWSWQVTLDYVSLRATLYSTLNGQSWSRIFVVALFQDSSSCGSNTQVQALHSCHYHYTHWHTHRLSTHKTCLAVDAGAGEVKHSSPGVSLHRSTWMQEHRPRYALTIGSL